MKLAKKLIMAVVVLVILAIAGLFFGVDVLAKAGVESGATYALGTETSVSGMNIGIFGGSAAMSKLDVKNPEGFNKPSFLSIGKGEMALSLSSLMEDTVVVPKVHLQDLGLTLLSKGGRHNFKIIMDELKKFESDAPASGDSGSQAEEESGRRFRIDQVLMEDVEVVIDMLGVGDVSELPVRIDRIELRDVGSDSPGGASMGEITGILVKALLEAVRDKAGNVLPSEMLDGLNGGLAQLDDLGKGVGASVGEVSAMIDGQMKDISGGLEGLTEGAGNALKDVGDAGRDLVGEKGLGALLNPKEKEDE
ncbi:MAG: DUF748 domain-containing protein [Planctomycetota bacterium]|jgi:hypothetical protein